MGIMVFSRGCMSSSLDIHLTSQTMTIQPPAPQRLQHLRRKHAELMQASLPQCSMLPEQRPAVSAVLGVRMLQGLGPPACAI